MKPGTFSQIYIHLIFAVKYRECLLNQKMRKELYKYTSGIIENKNCKSIIVNGYNDHIHILIGLQPSVTISDLVRDIKRSTSLFINEEKQWFRGKFAWQNGYGVFSYSRSQLDVIYKYIRNQQQHHDTRPFREEYVNILRDYDVEFDEKYLFDFF